jgi:hypothetical protein
VAATSVIAPAPPSSGFSFGDIYTRVSAVKEASEELIAAYENDVQVVGLADRANTVGQLAQSLAATLYDIDSALTNLAQ